MPSGHSVSGNWALGLNIASKNKREAFLFIQFATNKENDKIKFIKYGVAPSRLSTVRDPEVRKADPRVSVFLQTIKTQAHRPRIPEEPKLEDVTVGVFSEILMGKRPNTVEELNKLANQWLDILAGK